MRHVFVLSRDHPWSPWLHDYLRERFGNDSLVDIIVDRRFSERRAPAASLGVGRGQERRRAARRREVGPEEDLQVRSHYIVEL